MIVSKIIRSKLTNRQEKEIFFGHPDNDVEREEMYRLRNTEYVKRGYIEKDFYSDSLDYDEHDKAGNCVYFIAKVDDRIIGTLRFIFAEYLPTESECFKFDEPEAMKAIPRDKRVELGRLIVTKYSKDVFFPRHVIMFGLLLEAFDYCNKNDILGGYSFIKDKLKGKLRKLKIPIHVIESFEQVYKQKTLQNYFNDKKDKVWPVYYIFQDLRFYFWITKFLFLKKVGNQRYISRKIWFF